MSDYKVQLSPDSETPLALVVNPGEHEGLKMEPGDIAVFDEKQQKYVLLSRRRPYYWLLRSYGVLLDVVAWFRALPSYWHGFKVGMRHISESPGCRGAKAEIRFDDVRGAHWFCRGCLRPVAKFEP